jgi:twitching motility protein PilT
MELIDILNEGAAKDCSDIYLKAGAPPTLRIDGELVPISAAPVLSKDDTYNIAKLMMNEERLNRFDQGEEIDFAYEVEGLSRFRVNCFRQRETTAIVMRRLSNEIPDFKTLGLPPVVEKLAMGKRGLVLVTGMTGSGKTTTLASMINYINETRACHIVTIEDPIEITFKDKKSLIEQREIGNDTRDFGTALKYVLRQAPDVILLGELRDLETVEAALQAAETGHLVLATLHTINTIETINRLIDFFPEREDSQIRQTLAGSLRGIISQRLIQKKDGKGRVPAVEIFIANLTIRSCILEKNKMHEIPKIMAKSGYDGMQTFDQSLLRLYQDGVISMEDALANANSPNDLKIQISQLKPGF